MDNITKSNRKIIDRQLLADDGSHDSNDIFRYLAGSGIHPCIKVRKNAKRVRLKTSES